MDRRVASYSESKHSFFASTKVESPGSRGSSAYAGAMRALQEKLKD